MDLDYLDNVYEDQEFLELIDHVLHPRVPQIYRNRPDHFDNWNEKESKARFRLEKEVVIFIIEHISDDISSATDRNHAITPTQMVCLTLRFLATGSFLQVAGDFAGMDKSTASRKIHKVLRAIAGLSRDFIMMPRNEYENNIVRQGFYDIARLPRCIGALDCTHVKIQSPGGPYAETYRNRKGFFSFNVQAICNANLKFQDIVCRWPGSAHDSKILRNSRVKHDFENGVYNDSLLVADSGYAIKTYVITPLLNPQTPAQHLFNEAQIRTRNPVERAFGVLKRRFPILALGIRLKIENVEAVVLASAVLHNIALSMGYPEPPDTNEEIEAAIELTNNINNYVNIQIQEGINNSVRYALIHSYFQNLL